MSEYKPIAVYILNDKLEELILRVDELEEALEELGRVGRCVRGLVRGLHGEEVPGDE
jgi:hypothetical protein